MILPGSILTLVILFMCTWTTLVVLGGSLLTGVALYFLLAEVKKRNSQIAGDYDAMKTEFSKVRAVICELADVLDADFPSYVVEEDKSHKFMVLEKMQPP